MTTAVMPRVSGTTGEKAFLDELIRPRALPAERRTRGLRPGHDLRRSSQSF